MLDCTLFFICLFVDTFHIPFCLTWVLINLCFRIYSQGIVGCTHTNVPQESLENTINTMGTLLGVHPIVPWYSLYFTFRMWSICAHDTRWCEKRHCMTTLNINNVLYFWWSESGKKTWNLLLQNPKLPPEMYWLLIVVILVRCTHGA